MSQSGLIKAVYRAGRLELLEPVDLPEGSEVWVELRGINAFPKSRLTFPTRSQRSETLSQLVGVIHLGGDALADSEALYNADRD